MRKKFTLLLASLFLTMGSAWAYQFSYDKTTWTVPATNHEKVTTVPEEVFTVYNTNYADAAALDANKVGVYAEEVNVSGGTVTVKLQYVSGNGSNIRLDICGVDLVAADGSVKYKDYHFGYTGGNSSNNIYTLSDVVEGSYTLRVFVPSQKEDFTNASNNSRGNMTVTGALQSIRLTTDPNAPVLYTIKNVRGNAYAGYNGHNKNMFLRSSVNDAAQLFYFTAGTTEGTYKIHNYISDKKCAGVDSWTAEGIDWYIQSSGSGVAISKAKELTADGSEAWNDYQNNHKSIAWFGGNDAGSVWAIEAFEGVIPTIQLSTEDNIVLHYIRSARRDSYVNFEGHNVTFKEGNLGLGSYWYFVQDEAAQAEAPEGVLACRIYNAAHATAVENYTSGFMGTDQWPAKVFYIERREIDHAGYVIYLKGESNGWHDYDGDYVGAYGLGDNGSIWQIYPSDKTAANFVSEATTAKNNALNAIAAYEYAGYYTYPTEAIATAKAAVEALGDVNVLATAVNAPATISAAMEALRATEKGATAPVAGQYIQLKNKQYNTFLKANDSNLSGVDDKTDLATIWYVEAGEGSNVKLKNDATGKYIGQIRKSENVAMVDAANAKQFAWTNQADVYAVFHETSGGDHAYGHVAGHNVLVGWEPNADATQWVVAHISVEPYEQALQEALDYVAEFVGAAVGQKTVNETTLAEAKATAEGLLAAEEKTLKALVDAKDALYAIVEAGTINLPVAGKYYQIKSANPDFFTKQGVEMAIYSSDGQGRLAWKALDSSNKAFYWTITPKDGKFILKNEADGKYVPAVSEDKYMMTATETEAATFTLTWLTVNQFKITGNGTMHMMGHGSGAGTGDRICSYDGGINSSSAWTIVEVEDPDLAAAKAALKNKIDELNQYIANATGKIGYYQAVATDELEAAVAEAEDVLNGGGTDVAVYEAAAADLSTAIAGLDKTIILPKVGKFYRFKHPSKDAYMLSDGSGNTKYLAMGKLDDNKVTSIFYYGEDGTLLSYAIGRYLSDANGNDWKCLPVGTAGNAATFGKGSEIGTLGFYIGSDNGRAYYSGNADNGYVNAGGTFGSNAGYDWVIEEVTSLPVAVRAAGYATFIAPVAVEIPEGVKAYTGKVTGDYLILSEVEGIIPANRGVVLEAEEGSYNFNIVADDVEDIYSDLKGSTAAVLSTSVTEGKVPYTLQKPADDVVFMQYDGEVLAGSKAYLELDPQVTSAISIRFEGTTGIDNSELTIQNSELIIYDLLGRRVEAMTKGGIYIVNGKKVVVK